MDALFGDSTAKGYTREEVRELSSTNMERAQHDYGRLLALEDLHEEIDKAIRETGSEPNDHQQEYLEQLKRRTKEAERDSLRTRAANALLVHGYLPLVIFTLRSRNIWEFYQRYKFPHPYGGFRTEDFQGLLLSALSIKTNRMMLPSFLAFNQKLLEENMAVYSENGPILYDKTDFLHFYLSARDDQEAKAIAAVWGTEA